MRLLSTFSLIGFTLLFITACNKTVDLDTHVDSIHDSESLDSVHLHKVSAFEAHRHPKPGAALHLSTEFSGPLVIGRMANLMIQFWPEYSQGDMSVEIVGGDGLMVQGETNFTREFFEDEQISHELLIGAEEAGEYRLSVAVNIITSSGLETARVFSETISIESIANESDLTDSKNDLTTLNSSQNEEIDAGPVYLPAAEEVYIVP